MSIIIHIPSWFPNKNNITEGIFIKNMISSISQYDKNNHVILSWHDTSPSSISNPISILLSFIKSKLKKREYVTDNIRIIKFNFFYANEKYFGSNTLRIEKKIENIVKKIKSQKNIICIHAHVTYPSGVIAYNLKKKFNIDYIITEHMGPFPFLHLKNDLLGNIINPICHSKFIISVSNVQKIEIENITNVCPLLIPNVVKSTEFTASKNNILNNNFVFLNVSFLSEIKRIDLLIFAISELKKITNKPFNVRIVGDGKIKNNLNKLASKLNVEDCIVWVGFCNREKIISEYKNSNAFVCSSSHESFGVSIVESLASGRPVVSTKCGGPEDIITIDNGFLVENESVVELANGMLKMIENYNDFNFETIYKTYFTRYSEEVISRKYQSVYDKLI